jgi:Raf kinase inhibitor-like YbhB/YbcL family protein
LIRRLAIPLCLALLLASAEPAAAFTLASSDLASGTFAPRFLYDGAGCSGGNVSPALAWSDPPQGTKSFGVTLFDPDAPTGQGWWHWVVYDIPAAVHSLPAGAGQALPAGARQTRNDFGGPGYGGPCPPAGSGPHRYVFTVYALNVAGLGGSEGPAEIAGLLRAHAIATASFMVSYGRP